MPPSGWTARHRIITAVMWLHVPVLAVIGLVNGYDPRHVAADLALVVAFGVMARLAVSRAWAATFAGLGLLTCSATLIHLTGGLTEAHFHFFVILPLVALYQVVRPFVASVAYVVLHHSVVTLLAPESVFSTSYAQNKPLLWAGIHAGFVVGGVLVQVLGWRYAERARHVAEAQRAQDEATRREALEARVAAAQEARPRAGQCPPPQPEERR